MNTPSGWNICLLLALLCAGSLAPTLVRAAPPGSSEASAKASVVESIQCEGLQHVQESAVRDRLALKPGGAFTMERMEEDRRAVLLLGFFRTVTTAQRTVDGKTSVTFRLVEWPQVAHLRVLGNSVVDRRTLLESISTQLGQVLCAPQLVDDIHAIEQLYRERGYVAQVSQRILDEATSTGILKFEILEVQVAEIKFEGGDAALQERCRKALRELPPRLYRPEAVTIDQARLLRVKGIRRADPKVEPITPGKVRIRWQLEGLPSRATATVTQSALRASM